MIETTQFVFEQRGGERVIRTMRTAANTADRMAASWTKAASAMQRLQRLSRMTMRTPGAMGAGIGAVSDRSATLALQRIQKQLGQYSQAVRETGKVELEHAKNAVQKTRQRIAEINRLTESIRLQKKHIDNQISVRSRLNSIDRVTIANIGRENSIRRQQNQLLRQYGLLGPAVYRLMQSSIGRVTLTLLGLTGAARRAASNIIAAFRRAGSGIVRVMTAPIRAVGRMLASPLGLLAGGFGGIMAVRGIVGASDAYLNIANRIAATNDEAARSTRVLVETQQELFAVASRARSPIEALAELYGRLALGADGAVKSQQQLLDITETVGKAAAIGGGTQASIQGALIQLSQIFGAGGQARGIGQELRSIREQAPFLFKIIAQGLGEIGVTARGTTTELEKMAEAGNLSASHVAQAILSMQDEVEGRFARITPTISQAFTVMRNSAIRFIGVLSNETGAGKSFAQFILGLARSLDEAADGFAKRIQTVVDLLRQVYLMDLPREDFEAASERLDRIMTVAGQSLKTILTSTGTALVGTLIGGAEIAGAAFARVMGRAVRKELSGVFDSLGMEGRALSVLAPQDRAARLDQMIDEQRRRIMAIQEPRVGGYIPGIGRPSQRDQRRIQQMQARAAMKELIELQKQRAAVNLEIAASNEEIRVMADRMIQEAVQGFSQGWKPSVEAVTSALSNLGRVIDEVRQETTQNKGAVDSLIERYKEWKFQISDVIGQFRKLRADAKLLNEGFADYQKSLEPRRLRALGFDDQADAMERASKTMEELEQVRKRVMDANPGVNPTMLEAQIRRQQEYLRSQVHEPEAQRAQFDRRFSGITGGVSDAESAYRQGLEMAELRRELGDMTGAESQKALNELTQQYKNHLQDARGELEALRDSPFLEEATPLARELAKEIRNIDIALLELEKHSQENTFAAGFKAGFDQVSDGLMTVRDLGKHTGRILTEALGGGMHSAMESIIQGTESASEAFSNLAASVLSDLSRMIFQLTMFNALQSGLSGTGFGSFLGFANGGAFSGGQLTPYAQGGVVDRPTIFPMARGAGLMGEAGPEAVMPLNRDEEGNLGVRSQGGNDGVQVLPVQIMTPDEYDRFMASRSFDQVMLRKFRRPEYQAAIKGASR